MDEQLAQDEAKPSEAMPQFRWLERAFWTVFLRLPFFTGLLQYNWLPNESFDADRHELLDSDWVEDGNGNEGERAEEWRDKTTHKVYSRHGFAHHRCAEALRIGATCFFYGLLGCAFFAWIQSVRKKRSFYEVFGKATLFNLAIAAVFGLKTAL